MCTDQDKPQTWMAVAPITSYIDRNGSLRKPFAFGQGVSLQRLPDWVRNLDLLDLLSRADRESVGESTFGLLAEYTADSFGDPHPQSSQEYPISRQNHAANLICLATISLWLVAPSPIGYNVLLQVVRPGDVQSSGQAASCDSIVVTTEETRHQLTLDELARAKTVFETITQLERGGTPHTSIQYLGKALIERMWESRYIFHWIVMEAIFGPEDSREMTYRLSLRTAHFLGTTRQERERLFEQTKAGYGWRSKLVHGAKLHRLTPEKSGELMVTLETLIRRSLLRILEDAEFIQAFDQKDREEFLDKLSFEWSVGQALSLPFLTTPTPPLESIL